MSDTTNTDNNELEPQNPIKIEDRYIPIDEHIEYISRDGEKVGIKGVYLVPNLLTTAAMFCGFYAILSAIHHNYEPAVLAIICAMFFDALDGRVARLMNAQSAFGVEYDSLSDMVSFGLAPAIVAFNFGLIQLGKIGWSISFLYVACASLRLARFNTQKDEAPSDFFSGLASPAAAGVLIFFIWLLDSHFNSLQMQSISLVILLAGVCLFSALLMVSNLAYFSFKKINLNGRVSYLLLVVAILIGLLIAVDPPLFLFVLAVAYAFSGPIYTTYIRFYKQSEEPDNPQAAPGENDQPESKKSA